MASPVQYVKVNFDLKGPIFKEKRTTFLSEKPSLQCIKVLIRVARLFHFFSYQKSNLKDVKSIYWSDNDMDFIYQLTNQLS